jgi:endonuclease-3
MEMLFDLGLENEVADLRDRLRHHFGELTYGVARSPVGALVKSIISCRTQDEVSLRAYNKLVATWPDWHAMAAAGPVAVGLVIREVTLAEREAGYDVARRKDRVNLRFRSSSSNLDNYPL